MLSWLDRRITWIGVHLDKRPATYLLALLGVNFLLIAGFSNWGPALTPSAPNGMDLQLSLSSGVFRQIIAIWTKVQEAAFIRVTWSLDTVFPLAYAACVAAFYVWSCRQFALPVRKLVFVLPWLAALADYAENGLLLWILTGPRAATEPFDPLRATDRAVGLMSGFAIAKFTFLTAAIAFTLAAFFRGDIRRVVKVARYSVLSLVVGTLPIIALPQGRDLLLGLGNPDASWHRAWFSFWVVIWALSVWYWSRVLLDADRSTAPPPTPLYEPWSEWLPRVAGFLTLFLPGIAFFLVPQPTVDGSLTRRLGGFCIVLSGLFLAFVLLRRKFIPGRATTSFKAADLSRPSLVVLALSLISTLLMFRWLAFYPVTYGNVFGAVAILAVVAANTVFFGAIAVFLTRSRGIPIEFIALACAAIFSYWNDNHYVELKTLPVARPELRGVFKTWLANGAGGTTSTNQSPSTPVIVVAAEGGGIRAAYWTSLVLHKLADDPELQFANRLFAISNVSGSSFGSAVYAGLRQDKPGAQSRGPIATAILRERFLAPMVAKLVTGDLAQWFLPVPVPAFDRSTAMEDGFTEAYRRHVDDRSSMEKDFTTFRPDGAVDVPVLILNSTSVQTGRRVVASPYLWAPDSNDRTDFHGLTHQDVSLSTAVHNTARFPYISAAGRLRSTSGEYLEHLVDGGYFENTGADTLLDVIKHLEDGPDKPSVRFIAIILTNSPPREREVKPETVIWHDAESLGELFAPVRTLLQTRNARGELALRRLRDHVGENNFIEFGICRDSSDVAPRELPRDAAGELAAPREAPLGWQLSQETSELLEWHVERDCIARRVRLLKQAINGAAAVQ